MGDIRAAGYNEHLANSVGRQAANRSPHSRSIRRFRATSAREPEPSVADTEVRSGRVVFDLSGDDLVGTQKPLADGRRPIPARQGRAGRSHLTHPRTICMP